jgi:Glycosyl transferase family 2
VTIRFVSVVGSDTGLLDAAIAHYRGLGVESFHITGHIESFDDPEFRRAQDVLTRHGLAFAAVHQGPWDEDLNAYLIRAQMRRHPGDWWVVADLDEFHVYDRPLTDIITACQAGGYDYVMGALLDRVAADGTLPALDPATSIWAQYALAGLVTLRVLRAVTSKVTLARGDVRLHLGQHGALTGRSLPAAEGFAQVHHFKWTDSVLPRLTQRVRAYSSGDWYLTYPPTIIESRRMLRYLEANGGRIDVTADKLALRRCGSDYTDYQPWTDLVPVLLKSRSYAAAASQTAGPG